MKAMTVIYSCFIAASVAIAADGGKMHRHHEVNSSVNSSTSISNMNGAPDVAVRHVRTAGRSEDPNTGMASPDDAQPIVDMRDSRYDNASYHSDEENMSATGATHKAKHKAKKAKAKAKDAAKDDDKDKAKDETKNSTKMDADQGKVADQQAKSSETDTEITRQVRREVMNDDKLSTRAQNITIVTQDGKVALRGSVPSAEEKTKLESMAHKIAGVKSVDASQVMISQ